MKNQIQAAPRGGSFRLPALLLVCGCAVAPAQPALTTIQDILYRADGTRFTGAVNIAWKPFQSSNSTFLPQQALRLDIVNGVLRVNLVPTTNASPGANYEITFSSQGRFLFTELWAVPPSATPLKVRDVRVSVGTVVGNPPVFGQLSQISDIQGLENELLLRPMRGFAFGPSRAAVINSTGQIDAAQGNLSDCVRVDGSAAPCATSVGDPGPGFVDHEAPSGLVNSANATFILAAAPTPAASLMLYRNGLLMRGGIDYNLSGATITFTVQSLPQTGDSLQASYRTPSSGSGGGAGSAGGLTSPTAEILCSGSGLSSSSSTATVLGSCEIPAGKLQTGDRVEVQFGLTHSGSSSPLQFSVLWGPHGTLSRTIASVESTFTGTVDIAVNSASSSTWFAQSRGAFEQTAVTSGSNTLSTVGAIAINLQGLLAVEFGSEMITLRYYTVTRHPAIAP
jgi:hypothetical protein